MTGDGVCRGHTAPQHSMRLFAVEKKGAALQEESILNTLAAPACSTWGNKEVAALG